MEGYQNHHKNIGSSTKTGCGFYVKEDNTFKSSKDPDIAYHDPDNEFQSTWTEIPIGNKLNIKHWCLLQAHQKNSNNIFLEIWT